jgi:hypothetical protein
MYIHSQTIGKPNDVKTILQPETPRAKHDSQNLLSKIDISLSNNCNIIYV